jgi:hypothetical protein
VIQSQEHTMSTRRAFRRGGVPPPPHYHRVQCVDRFQLLHQGWGDHRRQRRGRGLLQCGIRCAGQRPGDWRPRQTLRAGHAGPADRFSTVAMTFPSKRLR